MASRANKQPSAAAVVDKRSYSPLWLAAALTLAAIVFSPAIGAPFVFDDYHLPFANPNVSQMPARFWIGGVRPLLMATYWINYRLSGTQTFSYHAVNLILHTTTAVLVFFLLQRLILVSALRVDPFWSALGGSCVFLLHPLQTEAVDYIAGRSEIVCALFVLAGWLVFLKHFDANTKMSTAASVVACGAAAVLSKESGVCLALLLVATDIYWKPAGLMAQLRRRLLLYVPLGVGLAIAVAAILKGLVRSTTAGFTVGGPLSYALTECRVIVLYLRLFFFPAGQNVDWQIPLVNNLGDSNAWVYLSAMTLLVSAICLFYRRARAVSFGLLVFLLALAPTSSFVPIRDAMAERRMYLPILGLIFALIGVVDKSKHTPRLLAPVAVSVLAVLAILSYDRSRIWASDVSLWENAAAENPRNARAHASLGSALMLRHECVGAAREFKVVVELQGIDDVNGRNLGTAYECSRQPDRALATYRQLVAVHPVSEAYARIGYLEALAEHANASLAAFDTALRLDPNNAPAYAFRGVARIAMNDLKGAGDDFRHALAIDPTNDIASTWIAKLPHDR